MAYIGRGTDKISNIEKLDVITFDGSSSYTLQKNSVNFTPNSANSLQISIDGVVQAGNFTVSSSTIDFGVAIPATSTCDFIFHYGTGLITTPADGTVTTGKIQDGAVTSAKLASDALANTPAFEAYQGADQSLSDSVETKAQINTEVFDTDSAYDATTNYRFTVPTGKAGKYEFHYSARVNADNNKFNNLFIRLKKNGSDLYGGASATAMTIQTSVYQADRLSLSKTEVWDLAVGDYIELYVYADVVGGSTNGTLKLGATSFGGKKIGD